MCKNGPKGVHRRTKAEVLTKEINVLEHPAYSPDIVPYDFFFVPEDKGNIEMEAF